MEIKQLQKEASKVLRDHSKRDNIKVDDDYLLLKLTEELGEFIQSYIIHQKKCRPEKCLSPKISKKELSKELADVLGMVLVIAKSLNIDIEEAFIKKWVTREWIKK